LRDERTRECGFHVEIVNKKVASVEIEVKYERKKRKKIWESIYEKF